MAIKDRTGKLATPREVAEYTGIPVRTLQQYRWLDKGPAWVKLGEGRSARVRYRWSDVEDYLDANTHDPNGDAA